MLHTTFSEMKDANAFKQRVRPFDYEMKKLSGYDKNAPVTYLQILESCNPRICIHALAHGGEKTKSTLRLLLADSVASLLPIFNDTRVSDCIHRLKKYEQNDATYEELATARDAAWSAVQAWGKINCAGYSVFTFKWSACADVVAAWEIFWGSWENISSNNAEIVRTNVEYCLRNVYRARLSAKEEAWLEQGDSLDSSEILQKLLQN